MGGTGPKCLTSAGGRAFSAAPAHWPSPTHTIQDIRSMPRACRTSLQMAIKTTRGQRRV